MSGLIDSLIHTAGPDEYPDDPEFRATGKSRDKPREGTAPPAPIDWGLVVARAWLGLIVAALVGSLAYAMYLIPGMLGAAGIVLGLLFLVGMTAWEFDRIAECRQSKPGRGAKQPHVQ